MLKGLRDDLLAKVGEELYPYQQRFSDRVIDALCFRTGRDFFCMNPPQTGKSFGISRTALPIALFSPEVLGYPLPIGIYAPTRPTAGIIFRYVKEFAMRLQNVGFGLELRENNRDVFQLTNGARIFCKSAEIGAEVRGDPIGLGIVDETPRIPEIQLKEGIQYRGGAYNATYCYIGTPTVSPLNHYFFDNVTRAQSNVMVVHKDEAMGVNPWFRAFVEKRLSEDGEDSDFVKMQLDLQWITSATNFTTWEELQAVKSGARVFDLANAEIYVGIDWGKRNDSTVVTVCALEGGKLVILNWLELQGDNYDVQLPVIIEFLGHYRQIRGVFCDCTATQDQIVDFLRASCQYNVVGVQITSQSKHDMFLLLQRIFNRRELVYPAEDCKERKRFERQMLDLVKEYKGNFMSPHAPNGSDYHDDFCSSIALVAYGALRYPVQQFVFGGSSGTR